MIRLFIILLLLVGCGYFKEPKEPTSTPNLGMLDIKSKLYTKLVLLDHSDSHGFIMTDKCDATLFSGLFAAAVPSLKIDIRAAANQDLTQWYRRPNHDCGPEFNNSRSTISRDMILGVLWYMYKSKDLVAAEALMEQLVNNNYLLKGEGTVGELLMTPALLSTLAKIIEKLGGKTYNPEIDYVAVFSETTGYVAHLTVWHILLRGELFGKISESSFDILSYHRNRNPLNPLFQAAYHKYKDGNQTNAVNLLLDNKEWPSNRLPTTSEHCSEWPIERDYTPNNWEACSPVKEHTGAELVIIYNLIIKK